MRDTQGTGCGIFPVLIKDKCMGPACEWHDAAYTQGSWHQKHMTRAEVDRWFLQLMLQCAENGFQRARAQIYYRIVRAVGGVFREGKP